MGHELSPHQRFNQLRAEAARQKTENDDAGLVKTLRDIVVLAIDPDTPAEVQLACWAEILEYVKFPPLSDDELEMLRQAGAKLLGLDPAITWTELQKHLKREHDLQAVDIGDPAAQWLRKTWDEGSEN